VIIVQPTSKLQTNIYYKGLKVDEIEVRELVPSDIRWDLLVEKAQPVHSFTLVNGWKSEGRSFQRSKNL